MRSLVNNMVEGVTKGYSITLNLVGVGYRATAQGSNLSMTLGYSHPIEMKVPAGLAIEVKDQTQIIITGADKQAVGQFAANVRSKRAPEPFKGKGVKYANEYIAMKEGKKK
jgi:large subunit ribosomal protein L6